MQRQLIPGETRAGSGAHRNAREGAQVSSTGRLSKRVLEMRRKAATVVLVALSLSLGVYAVIGRDGLLAYQHKQRQAEQLRQQILSLQKENGRLALHDQRLQNDRDTIEYEAREQMHYTRPGEVIYTLPVAPAATSHK